MFNAGDTPIYFKEYQFTLAEAAAVSGVSEKNIRNWLARDVLKIGKKHFLGRWLFNFLDLVRLTVMNDLTQQVAMQPVEASQIANGVGITDLVYEMTRRDATGQLLDGKDGYRPNVNVMVAFIDGKPFAVSTNIKNPGNYYPPDDSDVANAAFRRAHIVIPIYGIVSDLMFRLERLMIDRESRGDSND
jgi:hypothetical protein